MGTSRRNNELTNENRPLRLAAMGMKLSSVQFTQQALSIH